MRTFARNALNHQRPGHLREDLVLPRRQQYHPSPVDWRDEILYFLLIDRFSNAEERESSLLDRSRLETARPHILEKPWRWDLWVQSGRENFQGGTIRGVQSKLAYLEKLGITTIWLSPVFKQRGHTDTYHGYGIQDFLEVEPRFGTRTDLVNLIDAAHEKGMRIILDIIFNHSGSNWNYPASPADKPPYLPFPNRYPFGSWLNAEGEGIGELDALSAGTDDGVWPAEFMNPDSYTRAGKGSLDDNEIDNPVAEHKRTDFDNLRDFDLSYPGTLTNLALCYKYWIALSDCDGFRIDTLKHVSLEEARNFCGTIKEFAANLGKTNFFLVGEIAGGDRNQSRYLDALNSNLNAVLDIAEMRISLNRVAKGLGPGTEYFDRFVPDPWMGSHRNLGNRHVSILDDHDHVFGEKIRFSADVPEKYRYRQVVAATALQLYTLGIPCIYYGTEQAFAGPEFSERKWLSKWKEKDWYLREAMFGPTYPRKKGRAGLKRGEEGIEPALPGFGPFGTCGRHCFDMEFPAYLRIAALAALRKEYPALRHGRQYFRPTRKPGSENTFSYSGPGNIIAWSRILDDEEVLCVMNANGEEERGAEILVDANLNPVGSVMEVILNSDEVINPTEYGGTAPRGNTQVRVSRSDHGSSVLISSLAPSSILLLTNHARAEEGKVVSGP